MTLPDAYRGHAPVTWDTKTLKTVIDALGGIGAIPGNLFAPSAKAYFCDVANGDGTSVVQSLPNAVFTKMNAGTFIGSDTTGSWNSSTHVYTVPVTGMYLCRGLLRVADSFGTSSNVGMGIHTSEADGSWFQWNKYVTGGGIRCTFDYTRMTSFNAGNQLRLFAFQDSGFAMNIVSLTMAVWRIG